MTIRERYSEVVRLFSENMPSAQSELVFNDSYQLICAVMLSAQCTDRRVNMTTPELFRRYPDVGSLSRAEVSEVYGIIKSISYPNSKAEHLVGMARKVMSEFGGEIPSEIDSLMTLPGVGRKTANVVASIIWSAPVIAVDTHVFRVSRRLGLSKGKTPEAVERDLERHIREDIRPLAHHWLILHGRYVCKAREPECGRCYLRNACLSCSTLESASSPRAPK